MSPSIAIPSSLLYDREGILNVMPQLSAERLRGFEIFIYKRAVVF